MTLNRRRVELVGGSPFWPTRSSLDSLGPRLDRHVRCDVCVIGGGITGAIVSFELMRRGVDVVLIEANSFASGSTRASTALLSYDFDLTLVELAKQWDEARAVRAYLLCDRALSSFDPVFEAIGDRCSFESRLAVRADVSGRHGKLFEQEVEFRNKHLMRVDLLDREDLRRRFGIAASRGIVSANAAQIDPFMTARRMIEHLQRSGLRAFENSPVTCVDCGTGEVVLKSGLEGSVTARRVLFATGYASETYLKRHLADFTTDFCFATQPVDVDRFERCHVVEHAKDYVYASSFDDRIVVGAQDRSYYSAKKRSAALPAKVRKLANRVSEILPDIDLEPETSWAGTFARSRHSLPFLVRLQSLTNALFVLGYGGNGIASSAMLAPIAADWAMDRKNSDFSLFEQCFQD